MSACGEGTTETWLQQQHDGTNDGAAYLALVDSAVFCCLALISSRLPFLFFLLLLVALLLQFAQCSVDNMRR